MILNITKCETLGKEFMVHYKIGTKEKPKQQSGSFHCKKLQNTVIGRNLIEILKENKQIKKIIMTDPHLAEKQEKIFKAMTKSETHLIKNDGRVIQRNIILDVFTEHFYNKYIIVKNGKYGTQKGRGYIKSFDKFDYGELKVYDRFGYKRGFSLTVELDNYFKDCVTIKEEDVQFWNYSEQRKWETMLKELPSHETLGVRLSNMVLDEEKNLTEEMNRMLAEIEDKYGDIWYSRSIIRREATDIIKRYNKCKDCCGCYGCC